jgi:hypothetical protein
MNKKLLSICFMNDTWLDHVLKKKYFNVHKPCLYILLAMDYFGWSISPLFAPLCML